MTCIVHCCHRRQRSNRAWSASEFTWMFARQSQPAIRQCHVICMNFVAEEISVRNKSRFKFDDRLLWLNSFLLPDFLSLPPRKRMTCVLYDAPTAPFSLAHPPAQCNIAYYKFQFTVFVHLIFCCCWRSKPLIVVGDVIYMFPYMWNKNGDALPYFPSSIRKHSPIYWCCWMVDFDVFVVHLWHWESAEISLVELLLGQKIIWMWNI